MAHDLIAVSDVEARLNTTFSGTDLTQVQAFITDASALVREVTGEDFHDDDTGTEEATPAAIVPIMVSMIRRALDNPAGHTQASQQAGPFMMQTQKYGTGIYATKQERRMLRRAVGKLPVASVGMTNDLPGMYPEGLPLP